MLLIQIYANLKLSESSRRPWIKSKLVSGVSPITIFLRYGNIFDLLKYSFFYNNHYVDKETGEPLTEDR